MQHFSRDLGNASAVIGNAKVFEAVRFQDGIERAGTFYELLLPHPNLARSQALRHRRRRRGQATDCDGRTIQGTSEALEFGTAFNRCCDQEATDAGLSTIAEHRREVSIVKFFGFGFLKQEQPKSIQIYRRMDDLTKAQEIGCFAQHGGFAGPHRARYHQRMSGREIHLG